MGNHKHPLDRPCDPVDGQICIGTDKGNTDHDPPQQHGVRRRGTHRSLTLGLTACDNGATGDPTPTTSAPTTPTSSAPPTPKTPQELAQAALERYFRPGHRARRGAAVAGSGSSRPTPAATRPRPGEAVDRLLAITEEWGGELENEELLKQLSTGPTPSRERHAAAL